MAFPNATTLDTFTRTNSTNTLGANWANSAFSTETSFYSINSNTAVRSAGGLNANYWTARQFGGSNKRVEVGITISAAFNTGGGGRHGVLASVTNPGASVNGYEYYADQFGRLNLSLWTNGTATSLQSSITPSFGVLTTGDSILLVVDTAGIEGWAYKTASGWLKVLTSTNVSLTNTTGYVGLRGQYGTSTRLANFIAGELAKPPAVSLLRAGSTGGKTMTTPIAARGLSAQTALSGQGFLDSMGVNGHWNYAGSSNVFGDLYAYGSPSLQYYRDKISSLGITLLRDAEPYSATGQAHYNDLRTKGIKVIATAPGAYGKTAANDYPNNLTAWFNSLKPYADIIYAFEGPNEYDLFGTADPDPTGSLIAQQKALYQMVKGDSATSHIPVVAPSMGHKENGPAYAARDAADNPNDRLWNYFDYACWHNYSGTVWPGPDNLSAYHTYLDDLYGTAKPIVVTEVGYNNATALANLMNVTAAGEAVIKMFCEHYLHGIIATWAYELVDQIADRYAGTDLNAHWGQFYHNTWADKPAASYLRTLRTLMTGAATSGGSLTYALNSTADLGSLLLTMQDGSWRLLVWQRVFNWDFPTKTYTARSDVSAVLTFATAHTLTERKTTDDAYTNNLGTTASSSLTISSTAVHIFEIYP